MTDQPIETEVNPQLTEILAELRSLGERMSHLEDKLMMVSDVDKYSKLQEFLAKGQFKEADAETTQVILDTVAKKRENLSPDDMSRFPCSVLQVIDRLWKTYSQDRFGFSVQLQIYQSVGGSINTLRTQNTEMIQKFGEKVGWRANNEWQSDHYDQWDFSLNAPVGCFPAAWWKSPYGLKMATFCFMRFLDCELL